MEEIQQVVLQKVEFDHRDTPSGYVIVGIFAYHICVARN